MRGDGRYDTGNNDYLCSSQPFRPVMVDSELLELKMSFTMNEGNEHNVPVYTWYD